MEPLANVSDLEARGFPTTDSVLAEVLLGSVSEQVREAAGVPITAMTSTVFLAGTREQFLPLPGGPIREVLDVAIDGTPVMDAKLRDNRLWRPAGWGGQSVDVTVTYTHGLGTVPADIVNLVCMFVGAGLLRAEDGLLVRERGVTSERIDDYQVFYSHGDSETVDVTELPERVRDGLRARFAGHVGVTGAY